MNTYDYKKIIDEGKSLMKSSLDEFHDFSHAESVEKTSLAVYEELKSKNYPGIETVSPELVSIASWWHDCYKSKLSSFTVTSNFKEGKESGKIIRNTLTGQMKESDLEMLVEAVENHAGANLAPVFFLNKTKSPLHKILIEADAHDLTNMRRVREGSAQIKSIGRLMWVIVDMLEVLALPLYLRTDTTRRNLFRNIWNFWGAWLWDEKYFWKTLGRLLTE